MKVVEFSSRISKQRQDGKLIIEIPDNEQSKFEDMIDVPLTVNVKFMDIDGWIEGG
ncbi:MAG TPA: hypothetical protein VF419_05275 [Nitrososphaeraceae archaeon]